LLASGFFLIYYASRSLVSNVITLLLISKYRDTSKVVSVFNRNTNAISLFCNLAVVFAVIAVVLIKKQGFCRTLCLKRVPARVILLSVLAGIFLNFATSGIISHLPKSLLKHYVSATSTIGHGSTVWFILSAIIVAPIIEELIFRSLITSSLVPGFGKVLSVLISSLIFGAIHTGMIWFTYAFLLGAILSSVFLRTGSVYASIAIHFAFNAMNLFPYLSYIIKDADTLKTVHSVLTYVSVPLALISLFLIFFTTRPCAALREDRSKES
jgi:membrane protease YdiL (CAAX protease family)